MLCRTNVEELSGKGWIKLEQISNRQDFKGLYSPQFEHDNCGIGAVVNINGIKTHDTVANALTIVETLEHRAGKDFTQVFQKSSPERSRNQASCGERLCCRYVLLPSKRACKKSG